MKQLTDWRAGCGRPARPVRREGRLKPMRRPYPYFSSSMPHQAASRCRSESRTYCKDDFTAPLKRRVYACASVARGPRVQVFIDHADKPALEFSDSEFTSGAVGIRQYLPDPKRALCALRTSLPKRSNHLQSPSNSNPTTHDKLNTPPPLSRHPPHISRARRLQQTYQRRCRRWRRRQETYRRLRAGRRGERVAHGGDGVDQIAKPKSAG